MIRAEDIYLYDNVQKCALEIEQREEWARKDPKFWGIKKFPNIVDDKGRRNLTKNERQVIKYLRGDVALEEVGINPVNARHFLRIVKIIDLALKNRIMAHSSYPLRKEILQLCSPQMSTTEAYTMTVDPQKMGDIDYLCRPENWMQEEVGHQAKAIAAQFARMVSFSRQIQAPLFYAIRGNTGSGKTSLLQEIFKTALDQTEELPVLSLDPLKYFLKKQLKLTNVQIYEEANALFSNYLNGVFQQKALRFIFDSRLLTLDYIQKNVISPAEKRGEEVRLIDLDVPLSLSLVRSLVRDPFGKDSCVPPEAIEWGYLKIRRERAALIATIKEHPQVTSYKLYQGQVLIAEKGANGFQVYSNELYEESLRIPTQTEMDECLNRVIDATFVDEAVLQKQIYPSQREALTKWSGKTVGAALKAHAYQLPDGPVSAIPPDAVRFEVPGDDLLLAKYEEFYKKRMVKHFAEELKSPWRISPDEKTLYVESSPHGLRYEPHFVAHPIVLKDEESLQSISISSRIDFASRGYTKIVPYAKEHEDPVRFLIDHYRFWSFYMDDEIEFLGNYLTHYGVLDIFEKILEEKKNPGAAAALGKALEEPSLKQRAIDLLFKYGEFSELAPYLHEESVRKRFEEIAAKSPDYQRRIEALNILEKTHASWHALKVDICAEILTPLLDLKEPEYLEEVIWLMPRQAYPAIAALGGRKITDRFCEALFNKEIRFFSILKYIAMETEDQSEFDHVVQTLIDYAANSNGYPQRIEIVLKHIQIYNPRFPLPAGVKISDELSAPKRPLSSSGEEGSRRWHRFWKCDNALLDKAMRDPAISEEKRVAALRQAAMCLFIPKGSYISPKEADLRVRMPSILEALTDTATPKKLRFEAKRIQRWLD